MRGTKTVEFLGLAFDQLTQDRAVAQILDECDGRFRFVVTPNVHHVVMLHERPSIRTSYAMAWRTLCDSRILSHLARLRGIDLPVVTGSDLTAALIARASAKGMQVTIIGPPAEDCEILAAKYPGLKIKCHTPPMGFAKSEAEIARCVAFAIEARSPLTFLAVGMPQQEIVAKLIADDPGARGVGLCIGASIDFLTGKQARAPLWVQKASLEWAYRLFSDPARLARRYLVESPKIVYLFLADSVRLAPPSRSPKQT